MSEKKIKIALVGNPNSGKTSLFNQLTGLNQKVGNFPGITVDKKMGELHLSKQKFLITDLPGTYSLYPKSLDEKVVCDIFLNPKNESYPDVCIVTADAGNLKRSLLLLTQVIDLGIPTLLVVNMIDEAKKEGTNINFKSLEQEFGIKVLPVNSRSGDGISALKNILSEYQSLKNQKKIYQLSEMEKQLTDQIKLSEKSTDYEKLLQIHLSKNLNLISENKIDSNLLQVDETLKRYEFIDAVLKLTVKKSDHRTQLDFSAKLDNILTHKVWGYLIFLVVLFLMFQSIFSWASYPMDWIDEFVSGFAQFTSEKIPEGVINDLIAQGIIPGIGGIIIFIPQIALLFFFIGLLEETGYMARVTFIMDKIMRKVGLNGRSVVPLVSGVACAVPAIMSARTIDNQKDRLITIFVTPLVSCSARIPVYTILIAIAIPSKNLLGFINLQGLVMLSLYLLGFVAVFLTAFALNRFIKNKEKSHFIMELPVYRIPRWENISITILEKVKTFVVSAGKIILAISIILWVLASYGGKTQYQNFEKELNIQNIQQQEKETLLAAKKLEFSYAGQFGKTIEPVIKPLGFDWKIGIALITSFAAREVFVGTMATIFSVENQDESTLKEKMQQAKNENGKAYFNIATSLSLMIFYALAMQCMSTLATVKRETKSWKWPIIQTIYMTGLAYFGSLFIYQILS